MTSLAFLGPTIIFAQWSLAESTMLHDIVSTTLQSPPASGRKTESGRWSVGEEALSISGRNRPS